MLQRKTTEVDAEILQTRYEIYHADAFDWLDKRPENTIHAVVSDPPFGIVEFNPDQLEKRRDGNGGVWRLPAAFDGAKRAPTPRFTVLTKAQIKDLRDSFRSLAKALSRVLVPGAHVFLSSHVTLTHHLGDAFEHADFERRGIVARTVRTFRGGDRPKGAHEEFDETSVIPRAAWEPWLLFRKPLEGRIQDNLRKWRTGALRRPERDRPFEDLIESGRTPRSERSIAPHPALKPQVFMRQLVHAALPLGEGIVLDPFMGAGSTIAAAEALGISSIGVERDLEYFRVAQSAIPKLAAIAFGN